MLRQLIILPIIGFAIVSFTSFCAYKFALKGTPQTVTLDTKKILQDFILDAANSQMQGEELDSYVSAYTRNLENITEELARQENLIILPSSAVIAGDIDITAQVEQLIKKGYGNKGEVK